MSKKQSCDSTSYTGGFKITREPDGTFVATKAKDQLKAGNAAELNELIKKFNQNQTIDKKVKSEGCCHEP